MRWPSAFTILLLSLFLAVAVNGSHRHGPKRRDLGDALTPGGDDSGPLPATDSPSPSGEVSESPTDSTSSTSTTSEEEPTSTSTSSSSTSEEPDTTTSTSESPTASEPPSTTSEEDSETPSPTPTTSSYVLVTTSITIGTSVIPQTKSSAVPVQPTSPPELGGDGKDSSDSSGLSDKTRNTIIGVVVGVGGAIILGGLAVVIYRLRRNRNRGQDDHDDLMHAGAAVGAHSHENSTASTSPFKSTLDQYHSPGGRVNPSSNF